MATPTQTRPPNAAVKAMLEAVMEQLPADGAAEQAVAKAHPRGAAALATMAAHTQQARAAAAPNARQQKQLEAAVSARNAKAQELARARERVGQLQTELTSLTGRLTMAYDMLGVPPEQRII
jgi:hypothetical protein